MTIPAVPDPSPRATVRQCLLRLDDADTALQEFGGRPALAWTMRELCRFGVDQFLVQADVTPISAPETERITALADGLPKPAQVSVLPPAPGGVPETLRLPGLSDRFLLCESLLAFQGNPARLLPYAAVPSDAAIHRLMLRGPDSTLADSRLRLIYRDRARDDPARLTVPVDIVCDGTLIEPADFPTLFRRKALFLDRDGVLNIDHGYVGSRDRFEWVDGAQEAIRHATEAGWHVFIVTNQSGVARGLYDEQAVHDLLDWIADSVRAMGATIDDARFCPYHPEAPLNAYRQAHPWRKPEPGMLLDLMRTWEIEPARAVMIGDQPTDVQAALAAGIGGHLFPGGNLLHFVQPVLRTGS